MSIRTHVRRSALAVAGATLVTLAAAGAAQAHVTVKPESTEAGSFTQLTFRAPNESEKASTIKLKVTLPSDDPLLYVSVLPVPGWTATVTTAPLPKPVESFGTTITKAPHTVTWTADAGQGIKPGEYQNFAISGGPLPASGELVFPAVQTYSDGTVVDWTELQKAGADEPEHPAPSFTITTATTTPEATPVASVESNSDDTALAVGALVVGGIGVLLGATGLFVAVRSRRGAREA